MHNTVPTRIAPKIRKTSIQAIALATFVILAFAGAILTHADTTPITTTTVTSFSGRAFVLQTTAPLVGTVTLADTGPLPSQGGELDASLLQANPPLAQAEVLSAFTTGFGSTAQSEASVANIVLLPGSPNQITADFVRADTTATCNGVSGSSELVNLKVGGQTIVVAGTPNQTVIILGVLTLVINEQTSSSSGGTNSITVNAIDLTTIDGIRIIISSASSDITCVTTTATTTTATVTVTAVCGTVTTTVTSTTTASQTQTTTSQTQTTTSQPVDFVTGGGFIIVNGAHADFGFNAGYKPGKTAVSGQLTYIDHGTGLKVKATSIDKYYNPNGSTGTTRTFSGQAEVNGVYGYYFTVTATDNGEPGTGHDYFSMTLTGPNGFYYRAGSTLSGGNIQLHK